MTDYKKNVARCACKPLEQECGTSKRDTCICGLAYLMADEIERLREALRHYVSECDCNGGTYHEEDHITGKTLVKDCPKCEAARTALGEKE